MGCCTSAHQSKHNKKGQNQPLQNPSLHPMQQPVHGITGGGAIVVGGPNNTNNGRYLKVPDNVGQNIRIDTPVLTEENLKASHNGQFNQSASNVKHLSASDINNRAKQRNLQYFDISPKVAKRHTIYHVTNKFPVKKPYSRHDDWQRELQKSVTFSEKEVAVKLLTLPNRNWVQDQIKYWHQISSQSEGVSFGVLKNKREYIQLREQFNWFVWAVAQKYFKNLEIGKQPSLPNANSKLWSDGFEYKGVYFKVMPYEEAYYIQNEMQALKYVQIELLELNALSSSLSQEYGHQKETLHKDCILPLISGVSCGGFYLYGTPVIYTQELEQTKEFYREMNASKVALGGGGQNNSIIGAYNSVQPMQAVLNNQSNMSFSYLHNNINPDFVQDSLFKFMPVLKNITSKNLIPVIDFEEFNQKALQNNNDDQKFNVELKYFLVNLFDVLPRLSETSASTILMKFPSFTNEELTYYPYPKSNFMELAEIKKLISHDSGLEGDEEDSFIGRPGENANMFTKKFFTKHGWDFIMMQRQGSSVENKRASTFFSQREVPLRQRNNQNGLDGIGGVSNILLMDDHIPREDGGVADALNKYISPQKQSILRKMDTTSEEKIQGNVLVAAYNFKKEFKVKYSLNGHTYSTNIESLYSASVDQVAKIIEQSDKIYNSSSLRELMHRKGLNMRFLWVVLTKLRVNFYRELVMIDILLRTMRKIVNEEVKLKSRVQQNHASEGGAVFIDEYYQGNQEELYKEAITYYTNAILNKKFSKNKQVFDETLLGLFLSRTSIFGIVFSLDLKKEEFIYLESKDILEHIIEAPSKNPVLFINALQTYFKIDLKPDFLRTVRQDKHILLSKSQPITVNDIDLLQLRVHSYFTVKEQAYFMLASSITQHIKQQNQSGAKIKTKSEKEKIKQSFQKPKPNDSMIIHERGGGGADGISSTNQRRNIMSPGIGPGGGYMNIDSSTQDQQDSKTGRNLDSQNLKDTPSTVQKYQNRARQLAPDQVEDFSLTPLSQKKINQISSNPSMRKNDQGIDLSKLSKRNAFKPSQVQELLMPSILYRLKTFLSSNNMYLFDEESKTYVGDTFTVLRSYYEMPNIDIVNEWVIYIESMLKDVYSVNGSEQVLLEAFTYQATLIHFFENDIDGFIKVLTKIRETLWVSLYCSPEIITSIQILTGLWSEEQKEQAPIEAERSYLTAMRCLFTLYGDPRGRGNLGIPYTLFLSWKLSLLALAEDKKLQDSEFAEELFDACIKSLHNHKQLYKDQQQMPTTILNSQKPKQLELKATETTAFQQEIDNQEQRRYMFDIRKYKSRPLNVTVASGQQKQQSKASGKTRKPSQQALNVYVSQHQTLNANAYQSQPSQIKSKSHLTVIKGKKRGPQNKDDLDLSEIDFDIIDENQNFFVTENFKNAEQNIGTCPFQHWSIYRQQIAQILQANMHLFNKDKQSQLAQSQYQKQIYKEMLVKALPQDTFYQWMMRFNPLMNQCGIQWTNKQIKENIFSNNQQMISSSSSSAILGSQHHNMSSSSSFGGPSSAKEKRASRLDHYSAYLGKEGGGLSKHDLSGVLFAWGTEATGQLGLDILNSGGNANGQSNVNLKVLYPRMVVSLKDEIIKEVCCGHSHTMVVNVHGQVFAWGLNENGQLGLGQDAPPIVRKPVLNIYLSNITKLSAGNEHSLAVNKNSELYIWGAAGLTGLGDPKKRSVPTKMDFFNRTKIQQAVCGGLHTVVVTKDGNIYSWGSTEGGQLGLSLKMISQLCPDREQPVMTPQLIPSLQGIKIEQVACGEAHCLAMDSEGKIYGWGMSNYGQLGLGFSSDTFEPGIGMEKSKVYEPQQITHLEGIHIIKLYCGATFSLFQTDKGDLYGCGMNDLGQLGLETSMEDMNVATLERAKRGRHHQTSDVCIPKFVACFSGCTLSMVACGENHALAVSGDDRNMLWAWGMFRNGQLGLGEVTKKDNPKPIQTLFTSHVSRIACGSMHSLALIGDSTNITISSQHYANNNNNNTIHNVWNCDIRGLSYQQGLDPQAEFQEYQVPNDGEGRIKNPK